MSTLQHLRPVFGGKEGKKHEKFNGDNYGTGDASG